MSGIELILAYLFGSDVVKVDQEEMGKVEEWISG